jgi:4-diphosphocytidyl-2-C-methyl-D-erythritol kinase
VPFFLDDSPSWVTGIGEHRRPVPVSAELRDSLFFFLVLLPRPTITATVFSRYRASGRSFSPPREWNWDGVLNRNSFDRYLNEANNDLEEAAVQTYPLIGEVLAALRATAGGFVALSGSGSSCFAICRSEQARSAVAKELHEFLRRHQCKGVMARSHSAAV